MESAWYMYKVVCKSDRCVEIPFCFRLFTPRAVLVAGAKVIREINRFPNACEMIARIKIISSKNSFATPRKVLLDGIAAAVPYLGECDPVPQQHISVRHTAVDLLHQHFAPLAV